MDRMGWKFNKPDGPDCVHLLPKGFGLVRPGRSCIWLLKAIILTSWTKLQNCLTNLSLASGKWQQRNCLSRLYLFRWHWNP
ncbi:LOW QUALITY PROTEIN: hypothetical protein TorRG33x02_257370 [Trema orientale]|uniref:Uncharacterized protein n=1 Tax=Trema orientale TaxID=63057 RepID=A0A2P5DA84_TREOI|nr:LOW QUALITY PROTEIN: hypothetical protein TorRG33x02_257370 [Trema orientale]